MCAFSWHVAVTAPLQSLVSLLARIGMVSMLYGRLPFLCSEAHERQQHLRAQLLDSLKAALPPPGTSLEARAGGTWPWRGSRQGMRCPATRAARTTWAAAMT